MALLGRAFRMGQGWGRRRLLPLALFFVAFALPAVWIVLTRLLPASDATLHYYAALPGSPAGGVTTVRASGTLKPGDQVIAIDARPVSEWLEAEAHERSHKGTRLTYTVVRDHRTEQVPVTLGDYPLAPVVRGTGGAALLVLVTLAVSVVVFLRRPRDGAARALLAIPILLLIGSTSWPFGPQVVDLIRPYGQWPYVVGGVANALVWGAVLHLALVLPRPLHLVQRRRWLLSAGYLLPFLLYGGYLLVGLPRTHEPLDRLRMTVQVSLPAARTYPILLILVVLTGLFGPDRETRRRNWWPWATLASCSILYLLLGQLPQAFGRAPLPQQWLTLVLLPLPVVLGESILRGRLFDVQLVLRRSLVFGSLAGSLLVLYLLAASVLARLFGEIRIVPLAATALVTLTVHPLWVRMQRVVDRRIFGQRHEPLVVASRLGRIDIAGAPEPVLEQVVSTLAHALRLSYAAVELGRPPETAVFRAAYGTPRGRPQQIQLSYAGQPLGHLLLGVAPGRDVFGIADQRLLDELARQVGMTGHTLLLATELQRSRERIVAAREEERRRLRRDLHDGLGASLAATAIQLEIARDLVRTGPQSAETIVDRLLDSTRQEIADVRRLVDHLRPPALDQLGLVEAIRERATYFARPSGAAGSSLRIVVKAEGAFSDMPAAIEVAAFHIVMEAVNNATRHAQAGNCCIRLHADHALSIEVADDGRGLPQDIREGVGLSSMRERAAEVGGTCSITNAPGGGTMVCARLPVFSLPLTAGPSA